MSYESVRDTEWQSAAYNVVRRLLRNRKGQHLLAEELLPLVVCKIGEPADRRSFGHVIKRLHADGVMTRAGFGRARSSNNSAKPRWKVTA